MDIKQILQSAAARALDNLDAELIIALALKKDRAFVLAHLDQEIKARDVQRIMALVAKRRAGLPFAYLQGEKEFYGLSFLVNPAVLVPRPETELMVEEILKTGNQQSLNLIDVGTGSGAIALSIAKKRKNLDDRYLALDISTAALRIARLNARRLDIDKKISFKTSDLLRKFIASPRLLRIWRTDGMENNKCPLIIAANLPYLRPEQIKGDIKHEPRLALVAGADGLKYYRRLLPQVATLIKLGFNNIKIILEIDPSQTAELKRLAIETFRPNLKDLKIKKDLAKRNRFLIIESQ